MESPDDIVRHPTCRRLIGTSQAVQAPHNFDVRRNYPTNKSLKSKHGSSGGGGGWKVWRIKPPAALTTLSLLNQQFEVEEGSTHSLLKSTARTNFTYSHMRSLILVPSPIHLNS